MSVRINPFVCRLAFSLFVAISVSVRSVAADDYSNTCNYNDELCGWVDETVAPKVEQESVAMEASLSTLAKALGARTGVAVHQFVEPFAMVGPYIENSLKMVRALDEWWALASDCFDQQANPYAEPETDSIDQAIAVVAELEPIDVESYGPSVMEMEDVLGDYNKFDNASDAAASDDVTVGVTVTPIDSLVGSSPIIATIEEPYLPYDLSVADLRLRSLFPVSTEAFCVRSRANQWSSVPLWTEAQQIQIRTPRSEPDVYPVDCWMEECIRQIDRWTEPGSGVWATTDPKSIGHQIAMIMSDGNQVVHRVAELIALNWVKSVDQPSAAGLALLNRAGASEQNELETQPIETAEFETGPVLRVAESPTQPLIR